MLNLDTSTKGTSFLQPINFGLAFEKSGYQLGVTGTVDNITAPSVSKTQFHVGWAGCKNANVNAKCLEFCYNFIIFLEFS